MESERRHHVRFKVLIPVEVTVLSMDREHIRTLKAIGLDLSVGGMLLAVPELLQLRARLDVRFSLFDEERIEAKAVVIRCERAPGAGSYSEMHRIGVAFETLSKEIQEKILKFIFHNVAKEEEINN